MRREELVKRVEHWQARMLPEWMVGVSFEEPDDPPRRDDWAACTASDPSVGEVRVHFRPKVLAQPAGEVDRLIVHELIHPMLDRILDPLDDALMPHAGEIMVETLRLVREPIVEEFVNRLTHLILDGETRGGAFRLTGA